MNRKGFVLIETIIVLIVVVLSMLGLYKAYSFVFQNLKQNKYYDNINDVYKVNIFRKAFNSYPSAQEGFLKVFRDNCSIYMDTNCNALFDSFKNNNNNDYLIYISENIDDFLNDYGTGKTGNSELNNTDINYLKTLESNRAYLIYHYKNINENRDYYASLTTGRITENE